VIHLTWVGIVKQSNSKAEEARDESVRGSEKHWREENCEEKAQRKVNNTVVDSVTTQLKELSSYNNDMSQILTNFVKITKEDKAHKMMMREQKLRIHEDRIMMMDSSTITHKQVAYT